MQRLVLEMAYVEDMPAQEIAESIGHNSRLREELDTAMQRTK